MTFLEFLKYYTILIAAFTPASIATLAWLNKKTGIVRKFDSYLDRVLYHDTAAASQVPEAATAENRAEPAPTNAPEKEEKPKEATPAVEDEKLSRKGKDEDAGIAWFQIKVGETYRCRINNRTAKRMRNPIGAWSTENVFVGEIVNDKYFAARKAGSTYVFFGGDSEDSICIYNIEVVPSMRDWEYQDTMDDVFVRRNINDVKARLVHTRLMEADFRNNVTRYACNGGFASLTYEHDERERVCRALYRLDEQTDESIGRIATNLDERMREITGINSDKLRVWTHEDENGFVDCIAFMRKAADGTVLFGMGRNWRVEGEEAEVTLNLPMVERSFARCLGDIPLDAEVGGLKVEDSIGKEKKGAPKKKAQARKRPTRAKPAQEPPVPAEEPTPEGAAGEGESAGLAPDDIPDTGTAGEVVDEDYNLSDDQLYYE